MGRVILMMNVTLDGCCDHTQMIESNEELYQYTVDLMDQSDGMVPLTRYARLKWLVSGVERKYLGRNLRKK
ncbi:hypothetical protein [Cohnella silvisoli]|uniref:Deaminase n=1 Tax=Cohnella silvisoli TaxID=2873699 RepID=A0ABV1KXW7_9BACL|nr:hypothetical protein [Cohnella silvisoli]